jgi:phage-related protein
VYAGKSEGKKRPDHSAFMSNWAADNWSKNRENIRNSLSSTFKVTSPKNVEYITNRLKEFCETHNITYSSLWNTTRTNKPITKGKAKGWKCQIIQT